MLRFSQSIRNGVIANFGSRTVSIVLQLLCTPIIVYLLGAEGYGLLGFYLSILAAIMFLDQAISPALIRALSTISANPESESTHSAQNIFKTFELFSLVIGFIASASIFFNSEWLVDLFLSHNAVYSHHQLETAVNLMALLLLVQWPSFAYGAALSGLRQQVAQNVSRVVWAIAQWLGSALVLKYFNFGINALFIWQIVCAAMLSIFLRYWISGALAKTEKKPIFDKYLLLDGWRFSLGALLIGVTGSILTQADKFYVSKYAGLDKLSAYSLAFTGCSILQIFVAQPIYSTLFPHFVALTKEEHQDVLIEIYRKWSQIAVLAVMPLAGALIFYPEVVFGAWIKSNPLLVQELSQYVGFIAAGTAINAIMIMPFCMQLANGWTSLSLIKNLLIVPLYLLGLEYGIEAYGPAAGAYLWLAINLIYYFIEVPVMHSRIIRPALWAWWGYDTFLPIFTTLLMYFILYKIFQISGVQNVTLFFVFMQMLAVSFVLGFSLPGPRKMLIAQVNKYLR